MSGETIVINQITGPTNTPVFTEVTSIRFCTDSNPVPVLATPCKVPPAGGDPFYYSFAITLCLKYSGTFADISNARLWSAGNIKSTWFPGSPNTGRMIAGRKDSGVHGFAYTSYEIAGGTVGTTGIAIKTPVTGHSEYNGQTATVVDVDTLTQQAPLVFDTRHIQNSAAGYSYCFVLQTEIGPNADHGDLTPITLVLAVEVI